MFCPRCEINYHQSLEKCVNCGTKLSPGIICMECGTKNRDTARLCNLCGKTLTSKLKAVAPKKEEPEQNDEYIRVCPNSHANDIHNIFCSSCGEFLELRRSDNLPTRKASSFSLAFNYLSSLF
ncbi:MAG: zinc ribbon domain-containing protein [Candidatus Wallbacteria bacterium]|nr:zinc ribbon domain-containing protein [Candidatus Wallbacteria bacterium]